MQVELHNIFAGKAGGSWKPIDQRLIDGFAIAVSENCQVRPPRFDLFHVKHVKRRRGITAADAHNRHTTGRSATGQGENRVAEQGGVSHHIA